MHDRSFLSRPSQLDAKIKQWTEQAGERLKLDYELSYSGHKVYALTLSNWSVPDTDKVAVYVSQPHAHEPGASAGIIDVIEQLVSGKHMTGQATSLDVEQILAKTIITFNPIGNPSGAERAVYDYYDGSTITNDQFWCIMRGEHPDEPGKMWHRFDVFDTREVKAPDPIGVVYEPVDQFRYVEPNRSQLSSFFRLFRRMNDQYDYRYWLDLHQTEFVNSPTQCCILLPLNGSPTEAIAAENGAWADEVTQAWAEAGYNVIPPKALPYTGVQADYFRQNWTHVDQKMHRINTEVKNNGADVPALRQMEAQAISIEATLRRVVRLHS
ncbi:MAG: Zinc carboxypeptidase [Paenibacillus sp.]|jgi:hypothetical protein|nr:Zinc carboxypeptidase [Paenibacillus sp.]